MLTTDARPELILSNEANLVDGRRELLKRAGKSYFGCRARPIH